ncbi:MAG: hypothetical protein E3J37_07230 [Anaerolineales bacterium]|nr:MAG: hypothetical protein E3J37_07230 [Anaerolineales bacterium]
MDDLNLFELITELGIIGVLIMGILAFVKGKIWPEKMVDKMLDAQRIAAEQSAKLIASEMGEKMKNGIAEGMEQGIARGYLKINSGRDL